MSVAKFCRIDYANKVTDPARYQVIVGQYSGTSAAYIAGLKRLNPSVKVFMYQALVARPSDAGGYTTMTTWANSAVTAASGSGLPSNFFLKNLQGQPEYSTAYGGMYFMDFGLPAYQQAAMHHAINRAKSVGFDGVFFDGIDTQLGLAALKAGSSNTNLNNYNYLQAMTSMMAYAGQQLHANGLLGIANIGGAAASDMTAALWRKWSSLLDGALEEFWAYGGGGAPLSASQVARQLTYVLWSEQNGKFALLNQDNTVQSENVYGLALALQVAGGHTMWDTADGRYSGGETLWPDYTTALGLGMPVGAFTLSSGVYRRGFANGWVSANVNVHVGGIS